jgi:nickel transport protein
MGASSVQAHGVSLYAWVEGDKVHTESSFALGRQVQGGLIRVYDASGKRLLEGRTDQEGRFRFKNPGGVLKIVVDAGMGHRGQYVLSQGPARPGKTGDSAGEVEEGSDDHRPRPPDVGEIRKMMEEVLEARLQPIQRELAEIRKEKGPGFSEVVGGLGFIFGVMGLIMYLRSRKGR